MLPALKTKSKNIFIYDVHQMVTEQNENLKWINEGTAILITDQVRFESEILPKYFSMLKFISFTRKLTKYGFSRSKKASSMFVFQHKYFTQNGQYLEMIQKLSKQQRLPKHLKLKMLREDNEIKIEQLQNDEKSYGTLSYEMENNQFFYQNLLTDLLCEI